MKSKRYLVCCIVLMQFLGCTFSSRTPVESFDSHYGWYVGKTIGFFKSGADRSDGKKVLPNGNIEEWWGASASMCILVYEYRPSDGVIVAQRTEGDRKKCIQSPYT